MKKLVQYAATAALLVFAAEFLVACCCCPVPTGGGDFALAPDSASGQYQAVAEHVAAQAAPAAQRF